MTEVYEVVTGDLSDYEGGDPGEVFGGGEPLGDYDLEVTIQFGDEAHSGIMRCEVE